MLLIKNFIMQGDFQFKTIFLISRIYAMAVFMFFASILLRKLTLGE